MGRELETDLGQDDVSLADPPTSVKKTKIVPDLGIDSINNSFYVLPFVSPTFSTRQRIDAIYIKFSPIPPVHTSKFPSPYSLKNIVVIETIGALKEKKTSTALQYAERQSLTMRNIDDILVKGRKGDQSPLHLQLRPNTTFTHIPKQPTKKCATI